MAYLAQLTNVPDSSAKQIHLTQANNNILFANQLLNKRKYKPALEKYIKANKDLQNYLSFYQGDDQDHLETYEFRQRNIFKMIGRCLEGLKYFSLAQKIYEHSKFISLLF